MTKLEKVNIYELANENPKTWNLMMYGVTDKDKKTGVSYKVNVQTAPSVQDHISTIMESVPGWFPRAANVQRSALYLGLAIMLDIINKDDKKIRSLKGQMKVLNRAARKVRISNILKEIDRQIADLRDSNVPDKDEEIKELQKIQQDINAELHS